MNLAFLLAIIATVLNGILAGASLDQSIKQLPARHKMGVLAFTKYAQAADLGNGKLFYAILGISAALATIIAAVMVFIISTDTINTPFLYLAALFSLLHSFMTSQAAPLYLSQKKVEGDEKNLTILFNEFEVKQTLRSIFLVITFLASLGALVLR